MSKAFAARLLKTDGCRSRPFHSSFAASLLKKFGWTEGEGLGKTREGMAEPIQIRRREEALGLGHEKTKPDAAAEWGAWWSDAFNEAASKMRATSKHQEVYESKNARSTCAALADQVLTSSSDSSSGDEGPSAPVGPPRLRHRYAPRGRPCRPIKPQKTAESDEESAATADETPAAEAAAAAETEAAAAAAAAPERDRGKRKKKAATEHEEEACVDEELAAEEEQQIKLKKHKKHKRKKRDEGLYADACSDASTAAAGDETTGRAASRREKKKRKFKAETAQQDDDSETTLLQQMQQDQQQQQQREQQEEQQQEKKRKKKKHKTFV